MKNSASLPVSMDNARTLIVNLLEAGKNPDHRKVSALVNESSLTVEAERVLRTGKIIGSPRYCPKFENWCFSGGGNLGVSHLEIRVGMDFNLDLESPVMASDYWNPEGER